ncbi:evolved beta-D-galactosidase [Striga asiatica]|uniref:Evolved beta-D-galactosidase n=1 Tax=Striga asiatica TaxID=4170 RepID=A0A5A7NX84_STRAF|nr:evolved beta-D-galactosidase [Striga asiatica]
MMSQKLMISLAILAIFSLSSVKLNQAARLILNEDKQIRSTNKWGQDNLLLPILQRGRTVGPPSPSGCTWVPGQGGNPCTATLGHRNFAGDRHLPATGNYGFPKKTAS